MPPEPEPQPQVTSESLRREFRRLRGAVSEYPSLRFLVERMPEDVPAPGLPDSPADLSQEMAQELASRTSDIAQIPIADVGVPPSSGAPTFEFHDYAGAHGAEWSDPARVASTLAPRPMRREDKQQALQDRQRIFYNRAIELNRRLKGGDIEPDAWMRRMMGQVKDLHTTAYAIGYSGRWDEISQSGWGQVGATVQRQYRFLRRWRSEIAQDGIGSVSLAQLNDRAQKYGAAASESFEKGYAAEVGMPANILPAYPGDGTTECYTRCKCRWSINILDKQNQDFDCTWTLGVAEHCRTCMERADSWVQLEIRNGVLVSDPEPIFAR